MRLAVLVLCTTPFAGPDTEVASLRNGDFELKGSKTDPVPGWEIEVGARNGGSEPLSVVELDRKVRRSGKRSLHLSVDRDTFGMQILSQDVEVRPGGTYRLSGFARTKNVRHERNAKGINQFNNCYLALFLFDGNGEVVGRSIANPKKPYTDDWEEMALQVEAPSTVRRVQIKMFLSISGDLWFDDLNLEIEGGETVPPPAVVFHDDFEADTEPSPAWLIEEGARNGGTSPVSLVEVDRRKGTGKSKRSLRLGGTKQTLLWRSANRYFDATPGDVFRFSASASSRGVASERNSKGIEQFENLHMRLVFFDESGTTVGAPRHTNLGRGDSPWTDYEVSGSAPVGAVRGLAGIFLSMSGDVWLDDIILTRQSGGTPAYDGWESVETEHLVIRFPADHPRAKDIGAYGGRLEEALEKISSTLQIPIEQPITVYLYRDDAQGKALTGRPLAYAEPERRAVHQDASNTPGHELVHVVALGLGYAQSGLFGEGIAVWLDGSPAQVHHDRARELLAGGSLPTLDALISDFRAESRGYPAAGSFCGWFLETHGLDTFCRIYNRKDVARAVDEVLDSSIESLENEWHAMLTSGE